MSLKPKEEIEMEVHEENDQFFHFETWQRKCIIDGNEYEESESYCEFKNLKNDLFPPNHIFQSRALTALVPIFRFSI